MPLKQINVHITEYSVTVSELPKLAIITTPSTNTEMTLKAHGLR